jgi:hypothetical protein
MEKAMSAALTEQRLAVVNLGVDAFADAVRAAGAPVVQVDWRPPGDGDPRLASLLAEMTGDSEDPDCPGSRIDRANVTAVQRVVSAKPMLVDVALHAREIWPDMGRTLLHAGPPIAWSAMCGPMKGSAVGAVLYEGWARSPEEAERLLESGAFPFVPCHHWNAVGPMSGIISASMPVFVVRNADRGNLAYTNFNEGIGKVLRFGANDAQVIQRLKWIENVLAPALKAALGRVEGGVPLKAIQAQALLMGDEAHSRNTAATLLFLNAIAVPLIESGFDTRLATDALRFIGETPQFFLNLSMVSSKATMDAGHGVPDSSMVTAIARNGVNVGVRVSGLDGRWFEAPADIPVGLFFPGFKQEDANNDLGDSAICETAGFGGFSFAASPALVQLVGGTPETASAHSKAMYDITLTTNPGLSLPALDFAGSPTGIDLRKVLDTGIRPVLTTGMAHKVAGVGQIGAGVVRVPMGCFVTAAKALAESLGIVAGE